MVTLGIPRRLNSAIIKIKPKEAMTLPLGETRDTTTSLKAYGKIREFAKNIDVFVIGPGLSCRHSTQALVQKIVLSLAKPMVIDADGLNALAANQALLKKLKVKKGRALVFTPHPGEMSRLTGLSVKQVQSSRLKIARQFAKSYNLTLVLKGHNTVVADERGRAYINKTGNPGMATAGSGDVLSGIIAAFIGQGLDSFEASKYAVYLHGLAGDLAAKEKTQLSLIASDIIDKLPQAIKKCS